MHAQTNVQLFIQLQRQGYSTEELSLVRDAYGLAVQLFTGLHRPSGKTFMDHVVGTASILVALHQSVNLIAAALIHAAYEHGDFGSGTKGISERKRQQVRQAVGEQVEAYVDQYTALRWNSRTIQPVYDSFHSLAPMDRDVLLIRLANELDDLSDLGVLYCLQADSKCRQYLRIGPTLVEMAEKLGFPGLAAELHRALAETGSAEILAELRSRKPGVVLVAPRSYCRRPGSALRQAGSLVGKSLRQLRHRISPFGSMADRY